MRLHLPPAPGVAADVASAADKLYLMTASSEPVPVAGVHFFTIDDVLKYSPFCADFGPFNLGMLDHALQELKERLDNPRHSKIVYWTSSRAADITNSVFLLGAFLVAVLGATPEQAWAPFGKLNVEQVKAYRDATWIPSTYDLHVQECWAGLSRALSKGLYEPSIFDRGEYFYYDLNGDAHDVVPGKFVAFKGPTDKAKSYSTWRPEQVGDARAFLRVCVFVKRRGQEGKRAFYV